MKEKQRKLLQDLRGNLVGALHTQPFTIYNDETIEELLKVQPRSIEELCTVKGFPKDGKRVKNFGESIIAIFTDTDSISDFKIIGESENHFSVNTIKKIKAF